MSWNVYPFFAFIAILCWLGAGLLLVVNKKRWVVSIISLGIIVYGAFIICLWSALERPPFRTMGETRLWYAFFLSLTGLLIYLIWRYRWIPVCTGIIASVFALVNVLKPEIHSTTLMPALQSPWFIPHVSVYILSYAMLGIATITAVTQLFKISKQKEDEHLYLMIDNIMYIGFAFLIFGLISGAIWAKEAWGHYWSWDPKETWAFITAVAFLICIHLRLQERFNKITLWLIPFSFALLMVTWIGVNYLPSAQSSVHVYSKQN